MKFKEGVVLTCVFISVVAIAILLMASMNVRTILTVYTNNINQFIDEKEIPEKLKKEVNAKTLGAKGFAVFLGLNRSADELGLNNHTYFIYPTNDNRKCYEL